MKCIAVIFTGGMKLPALSPRLSFVSLHFFIVCHMTSRYLFLLYVLLFLLSFPTVGDGTENETDVGYRYRLTRQSPRTYFPIMSPTGFCLPYLSARGVIIYSLTVTEYHPFPLHSAKRSGVGAG